MERPSSPERMGPRTEALVTSPSSSSPLHITTSAGATAQGILSQAASGGVVPSNDIFGRAMVYFSTSGDAGAPLGVHSWLFNATGHSNAADGGVTMNAGGGEGWNFATPWSAFDFGFTHYQTLPGGVDVFLDDFAMGDAMVACP